jgi:hypothetical protein
MAGLSQPKGPKPIAQGKPSGTNIMGHTKLLDGVNLGPGIDPSKPASAIPNALKHDSDNRTIVDLERYTPKKRAGYHGEWKRIYDVNGEVDRGHLVDLHQAGWRFRRADTLVDGDQSPIWNDADLGGIILYRDLAWMEMPEKIWKQRRKHMDHEADVRQKSIYRDANENFMGGRGQVRMHMEHIDDRDGSVLVDD